VQVQKSTTQGYAGAEQRMEADVLGILSKGEVGITEKSPARKLKGFAQKFSDDVQMRCARIRSREDSFNYLKRL
jgi:hypothetical protein